MGPKDIEVTNLIFQPIDSPYATSYWCPIESEALSSTVFEIFGPRNVQKRSTNKTPRPVTISRATLPTTSMNHDKLSLY